MPVGLNCTVLKTERFKTVNLDEKIVGLEEASEAVTAVLITNLPELLRERHDNERFEKLVWNTAAIEGY